MIKMVRFYAFMGHNKNMIDLLTKHFRAFILYKDAILLFINLSFNYILGMLAKCCRLTYPQNFKI